MNPEVEMLQANEEDIIGLAFPDGAQEAGDQLDQAARLLELLIFLEEGDDVFQARMERIGGGDFVRQGFGTAIGDLGLAGFLQLPVIVRGDVANHGLVGQALCVSRSWKYGGISSSRMRLVLFQINSATSYRFFWGRALC